MTVQEITKVQELIYTTRVETVMAPDVIVLQPEMTMSEVKSLMRSRRITGAPVVEDGRILGIVSLSDVINAMEKAGWTRPSRKQPQM